jgi:foldase protein PrsA
MLSFLRKNAVRIMTATIIVFAGSIVLFGITSTFFLSAGKKQAAQAPRYSDVALINQMPINSTRYQRRLYQVYNQLPAEQKAFLDPNYLERLKYTVFNQQLQFQLLLGEAAKQKVRVTSAEQKMRINQLVQMYKLNNRRELKRLLGQNNVSYKDFVNDQKDELKVSKLISSVISKVRVNNKDLKKAFKEVKASHILLKIPDSKLVTDNEEALIADKDRLRDATLKKAEDLYEIVLGQKNNFGKLAQKYSQDEGSASNGGDLGWFSLGQMVEEFEDLAFVLDKGDIGGPVETMFGFHLIKVDDLREKQRPEDLTDEKLKEVILKDKQDKALKKWMEPILADAKIDYIDEELKAYSHKIEGKYDKALQSYRLLESKNPGDPLRNMMISQVYQLLGETTKAKAEYERGLIKEEINPKFTHPSFHFSLADFYHSQKMKLKAKKELSKVEEIAKENLFIFGQIKQYFDDFGYPKEAKRIAAKIEDIQAEKKRKQEEALSQQMSSDFVPAFPTFNMATQNQN